jgi:hypothetical protein
MFCPVNIASFAPTGNNDSFARLHLDAQHKS